MESLCKLSATWGVLFGRVLLAAVFLQSAYDKVFNIGRTAKAMAAKGPSAGEPFRRCALLKRDRAFGEILA